jgi:hypothetical protein
MHLVCLGVMKRILCFWIKGRKDIRMTENDLADTSAELLKIKYYVPREFSRLPRI